MSFKHNIGLHLRIHTTLSDVVEQAIAYNLSSFQFFLIQQKTEKYLTLTTKEKEAFLKIRRASLGNLYIHSSYWINPATNNKDTFAISKMLLNKEIRLAQSLEVAYLVLHAGSAKGYRPTQDDPDGKQQGILMLAKMLNSILKKDTGVQILLENSAHGKKSIGNDLGDFALLKKELDYPERIGFCLDTAHAFSYGYDLSAIDQFVQIVDKTMGLEKVKLIHFNDSQDAHGSMQDRHAFPGHGTIGKKILQPFLHHSQLISIPKIIEGPEWNQQDTMNGLEDIYTW